MSSVGKIRRLLSLLERLQSGRTYNTVELAEFCGVSGRTIFRDLKMLEECGIQVLHDSQRQGYWIASHASLPPTQLTLAETLALLILAQEAGAKDRGIPFQDAARDAALKLHSNLPEHLLGFASEISAAVKIQSEPQALLADSREHYERTLEAITSRRKIRIRYRSLFESTEIQTLLSPYRVLFRRHTWYVIGRSSLHRAVRTFHVGRILASELTPDSYEVPPRFSLKRYLGNAWNLIRERSARTQVTVRFQPLVAANVAEVQWHSTQKIQWNDDGTLDFTVMVDGINEIAWWILGYGHQALVLEPEELRVLIRTHAEKMAQQYQPESKKPPRRGTQKPQKRSRRKI